MCARFRSIKDLEALARAFNVTLGLGTNFPYNPNVAPTDEVPIITVDDDGARRLRLARFGIPSGKALMLNTRTDSIAKGAKRGAYTRRRCIVPAQGFYEWRDEGSRKQPYMFALKDRPIMPLGGIWEDIEVKGEKTVGFSIITDEPNEVIAAYHDRMPLALGEVDAWLDHGDSNPLARIKPLSPGAFVITAKNPAMNNPRQKDESIIDAEADAAPEQSALL